MTISGRVSRSCLFCLLVLVNALERAQFPTNDVSAVIRENKLI